jgi:hypothetical protein
MPYEIKKSGSQYEVVNKDTGKSKGKSVSKEKALAHMRALYHFAGIKEGLKK